MMCRTRPESPLHWQKQLQLTILLKIETSIRIELMISEFVEETGPPSNVVISWVYK